MKCEIISKYFSTVDTLLQNKKTPVNCGDTHLLYHSEINFMKTIHQLSHPNAVELSEILNVTRGSVTQWGNKLEEKGMIERFLKKDNKKEKYYRLTKQGKKMIDEYEKQYSAANEKMRLFLSTLDSKEKSAIIHFLDTLSLLSINEFECTSSCCTSQNA